MATLVTKQIVATGEAFGVWAPLYITMVGDLGRSLLHVLPLVASEVLWVEEPLATGQAPVRPLITTEMDLDMTTRFDQ